MHGAQSVETTSTVGTSPNYLGGALTVHGSTTLRALVDLIATRFIGNSATDTLGGGLMTYFTNVTAR
jgi:hypothetical protein